MQSCDVRKMIVWQCAHLSDWYRLALWMNACTSVGASYFIVLWFICELYCLKEMSFKLLNFRNGKPDVHYTTSACNVFVFLYFFFVVYTKCFYVRLILFFSFTLINLSFSLFHILYESMFKQTYFKSFSFPKLTFHWK